MPMIEWDYWSGDDPKYDAWYDERINNLSDADHKEFLEMFKDMFSDFCEDKDDVTIKDSEWYIEFVDDMLIEEYESL